MKNRVTEKSKGGPIGISKIGVDGFKSLVSNNTIEIRPLTILAGVNSSGKSSIMQPLLLMKQTLGHPIDPGPLLIDGPELSFVHQTQFIPRGLYDHKDRPCLDVAIGLRNGTNYRSIFSLPRLGIEEDDEYIQLIATIISQGALSRRMTLAPREDPMPMLKSIISEELYDFIVGGEFSVELSRIRCFFGLSVTRETGQVSTVTIELPDIVREIVNVIHIPGIRGTRERFSRNLSAVESPFHGSFENYTASIIANWGDPHSENLVDLEHYLERLSVTNLIRTKEVAGGLLEIHIGRTPPDRPRDEDMVSIADAGFGVSQVLPILVACLVAKRDQLVYIEQPELHLHPNAQYVLAEIIAETAARGVRLVVETHSSLFILRVQTLIADGFVHPDTVKLHWFSRDRNGATSIAPANVDNNGAFGDWPEDFDDVEAMATKKYLDAVEARHNRGLASGSQ